MHSTSDRTYRPLPIWVADIIEHDAKGWDKQNNTIIANAIRALIPSLSTVEDEPSGASEGRDAYTKRYGENDISFPRTDALSDWLDQSPKKDYLTIVGKMLSEYQELERELAAALVEQERLRVGWVQADKERIRIQMESAPSTTVPLDVRTFVEATSAMGFPPDYTYVAEEARRVLALWQSAPVPVAPSEPMAACCELDGCIELRRSTSTVGKP